jgi:hypothetical protein
VVWFGTPSEKKKKMKRKMKTILFEDPEEQPLSKHQKTQNDDLVYPPPHQASFLENSMLGQIPCFNHLVVSASRVGGRVAVCAYFDRTNAVLNGMNTKSFDRRTILCDLTPELKQWHHPTRQGPLRVDFSSWKETKKLLINDGLFGLFPRGLGQMIWNYLTPRPDEKGPTVLVGVVWDTYQVRIKYVCSFSESKASQVDYSPLVEFIVPVEEHIPEDLMKTAQWPSPKKTFNPNVPLILLQTHGTNIRPEEEDFLD